MDKLYRSFLTVVEMETLVRAAERLHLTQPTLSRQIQQLELALGSVLFDRIGKRMVLNPAGELTYQTLKHALALEDGLRAQLESLADPDVGTIIIGAGLTPSIHLLPPILAQYLRLHPRVRFQVRTGSSREILQLLRARQVDLAVVTTLEAESDDLDEVPLQADPLWLVGGSTMKAALGAGIVPFRALNQWPLVLLREGSGLRVLVEQLAEEHGVALWVTVETDSLESISRMMQQGIGLSILPASSVREDIQADRLFRLQTDVALPARTLRLVVQKNRLLPAVTSQFVAWFPRSGLL